MKKVENNFKQMEILSKYLMDRLFCQTAFKYLQNECNLSQEELISVSSSNTVEQVCDFDAALFEEMLKKLKNEKNKD
jgi:hypothetical protein